VHDAPRSARPIRNRKRGAGGLAHVETEKETTQMITSVVLSLLLAILTGTASTSKGINPVQHSELSASDTTTTSNASKGINPVQHSE
jgi:hypothetical protein